MPNFAEVTIVGHCGRDAELRYTQGGKAVSDVSVATTVGFGDREQTLWWRVTLWGRMAEGVTEYLTKGKPVLVVGEPSISEWTDNDGNNRTSLEVNARQVKLLGRRDDADSVPPPAEDLQDIPF